jgi:CRISPR/Cas system CSM-associated protein Csm3 (group 7 of RAMP superfamily)
MNPYDFVRCGAPGVKKAALPHHSYRFDQETFSGRVTCQLLTLTHLFVPETQDRPDRRQHQKLGVLRGSNPLLPGSSIKGVVRSVAEAISGSCMVLPTRFTYPKANREFIEYKLPSGFNSCFNAKQACPACRIFGLLNKGIVHTGKIALEDARVVNEAEAEWITIEALMEPKPRHQPWYGDPSKSSQVRGRKFYFHRPLGPRQTAVKNEFNKTIEALRPGALFEFKVDYTNLTEDELALLVFALALENPMRHKFGMGKPLGLGSAELTIIEWKKHDLLARYTAFGTGTTSLASTALNTEVDIWRQKYHQIYSRWQPCLDDLRRIWTWDPQTTVEVKYPTQHWFKENPKAQLESAP